MIHVARHGAPVAGVGGDAARGAATRYGVAAVLTAAGLAAAGLLLPATDTLSYAPLLGSVAIIVWYGGLGPGLVSTAIAWAIAFYVLAEPQFSFDVDRDEVFQWAGSLLVAQVITWIAWAMRRGRERATAAAGRAERSHARVEHLHTIASALSVAATPEEVAAALVAGVRSALGASSAEMGVVTGSALRLVDPMASASRPQPPENDVALSAATAITAAARAGREWWVDDREQLEREFPDSARALPAARSLLAMPLVAGGEVVGALGIAFDLPGVVTEEARSFARLVAEMGGSALERAFLYAHERESRAKLEEILVVSPRFGTEGTAVEIAADACRRALTTLDADAAQVWSADDERSFEVLWREPPHRAVTPGIRIDADDRPGLQQAMEELRVMFVPDMRRSVRGEALKLVAETGVRSALRIPIVVGGRAAHVLDLDWERVVPEPDASFVALARRFADQVGLAIEQAERRRAQEAAGRRSGETRRLLDLSATLAAAATIEEVASAAIDHGAQSLGAVAGVVTRRLEDEAELEIVHARGFDLEIVERWRRIPLDAPLPITEAVRDNRAIVLASIDERDARYPALAGEAVGAGHGAWLALPLSVEGRATGGVALAFPGPRSFTAAELEFVGSLAHQAAQAFERARLLDAEHRARARTERIASNLAQLHALGTSLSRARSAEEVASAVATQVSRVLDARSAGVYVVTVDGSRLELLGSVGGGPADEFERVVPLDARVPVAEAIRARSPVWVAGPEDWGRFPDVDEGFHAGAITLGVTPMLADERPIGAVYITFDRQRAVDADERRFVETIGRQAAQPFDRVRLLESERRSRLLAEQSTERTRRLQRVTERLVAAASPADVGDVTVREGLVAVAGDTALLYVVEPNGTFKLLSAAGYWDDAHGGTSRVEAGASVPAADVVATGELVVLESPAAIAERYPSMKAPGQAGAAGALICAPLVVERRVLGALEVTCREPRHFDEAERLVVLTLARQSGQALERARLHEAETAAAERVRSLQEITAALSQAATAGAVVDTCLERAAAAVGARAGVVATLGAAGDVLEIAGAHGYEDGVWSATRLEEDSPLAEAARTGETVWALTAIEAARFRGVESARAAGDLAWAAIPLTRPGGTLGTLLLGFAAPTRLLNEDRAWLIALAGQCSQALDRSRLYEDERATRRRSQRLQALTAALSSALTAGDVASAFLEQSVAALEADGSALVLVDEAGEELRPLARRGFGAESPYVGAQLPVDARHPVAEAFRRRRTIAFASRAEAASTYGELAERPPADGIEAIAIRPLSVSGRTLGAAVFAWRSERRLSADEHALIGTMTSQCAQALDRARRYESERTIAEILQRSVLPERLPEVEWLELAARYVPGTSGVDVGGDWFDVIELERGRIGLVVGDVVGKGVQAAATMGQLRNALRAFAFEQLKPSSALTRLNRLAESLVEAPFATLAFLTVEPASRICRYTLAGHPPPVVRDAAGRARFLEGGRSVPLGVGLDFAYEQDVVELPPGAMLLLYTDGLVERRDRPLEEGLEQLRLVVESGPSEPAALVDHVLARMLDEEERNDDVAVLAAGLTAVPIEDMRLVLPSEPEALTTVRERLCAWLSRAGATEDEARDIVLAVWEACANAVEHAQQPTLGDFAFEASHASGRVRVAVRDSGRWRPEVPRDHRGFGLHLMRTLMDSVEVTPGARGTVVSMERLLGHSPRAEAGEGGA